jgi:hypothetical protein
MTAREPLVALFYMHRGFFARAMEANSEDPLGSRFAPSVLAAYTSACSFVGLIESLFAQYPGLTERMFFLFSHVFSCAVRLLLPGAISISESLVDCSWLYRSQEADGISPIGFVTPSFCVPIIQSNVE